MNLEFLQDAIERYARQTNPGFAVMLDGAWGSGKTYFVENKIKEAIEKNGLNFSLVSLYGISTEQQLADAILEGFLNIEGLSSDRITESTGLIAKFANAVSDASGDATSLGASILSSLANTAKNRISNSIGKDAFIVFDDLERSTAHPNDVLGWINNRVEHQGFRALIVCNEVSLSKSRKLSSKEKVVGFTYIFSPDNQYIIDASINALRKRSSSSGSKDYFDFLQSALPSLTKNIKLKNIRTVTHAISAVKEVLQDYPSLLEDEQRLQELVGVALFYSISYRDELVPDSDLKGLAISASDMSIAYHIAASRAKDKEKTPKEPKWHKVYKAMADDLLSDNGYLSVWQLVRYGFLDKARFNQEKSCWRESTPTSLNLVLHTPWLLRDEELATAFQEVRSSIQSSTLVFESYGEALNLLIKLRWLYKDEALDIKEDELDKLSLRVIENLEGQPKINAEIGHLWGNEIAEDSFLEKYLEELSARASSERLRRKRSALIELLISIIKGEPSSADLDDFYSIPGLDVAAAKDLLEEIKKASPAQLWDFAHAMNKRYARGTLRNESLTADIDGVAFLREEAEKLACAIPPSSTKSSLRRICKTLQDSLPPNDDKVAEE